MPSRKSFHWCGLSRRDCPQLVKTGHPRRRSRMSGFSEADIPTERANDRESPEAVTGRSANENGGPKTAASKSLKSSSVRPWPCDGGEAHQGQLGQRRKARG